MLLITLTATPCTPLKHVNKFDRTKQLNYGYKAMTQLLFQGSASANIHFLKMSRFMSQ